MKRKPFILATRGSPLALTQTNQIAALCRAAFPEDSFEIKVIKTTGDKLQSLSISQTDPSLPRGLFTKELEEALLDGRADLAVHSLKDLPTDLPAKLILGAVGKREDARDVLIARLGKGTLSLKGLPKGATIATASVRRQAQVEATRPDLRIVPMRGNVGTRLRKLEESEDYFGLILAAAGLARLGYKFRPGGTLRGPEAPSGLRAAILDLEEMLPCVGQGAIAIEVRAGDARLASICERLNDVKTMQCVRAERSFLRTMGGGCQSPLGAFATIAGRKLHLRALLVEGKRIHRAEASGSPTEAITIGAGLASMFKSMP